MKSQSFFDAELPSDPTGTYRYERHKSDYYDPEDIGLAYENADDIVFGVEADDEINYSDDDLGIEPPHFDDEDEIGLGIPLPDIEVLGGLTPAPQDPVSNDNDDYGLSMKIPFIEFAKEIVYTLASKVTGYCNLHELKEDLRKDTGLLPDYVVSHYGYPSFETFMTSDDMKRHVTVHLIDGKHYFLPKHCEKFAHIRNEQEIERAATMLNQNREENEKLCRALLPENRETTIKGRQLISELIYELGGEQKPVLWQDVQKKYKEKFNEELAGEALKKMFQRDKAIKIIETIFHKEIELYAANLPGQFFLKFRMPYKDIVAFYEEQLKEHSEAKTKFKSASEKFLRPRTNYKQNKVFPLCPMYPPLINNVSPPDDKNVPFGGITNNCERNEGCSSNQQQNISINNDNSVQKKSKFDISLDELGLCNTKKQTSFTEMLQNEDDVIAEENRIKIKYNRNGWTEEETNNLPAYEIINNTGEGNSKTSRLDCPVENVVKNGSGEVNKAVNNKTTSTKKIRYTARFAGQDFTDSEEESDDDDEENNNKIKQKEREKEGGGTKITAATPTPIELTKQSENEKEILVYLFFVVIYFFRLLF